MTRNIVGENIKIARKQNGFTQKQLSDFLGIDSTLISKYENGKIDISQNIIEKLAELFCMQPYDLINGNFDQQNKTTSIKAKELSGDDLESLSKANRLVLDFKETIDLQNETTFEKTEEKKNE